jgi:hypothetical protein
MLEKHVFSCLLFASLSKVIFSLLRTQEVFVTSSPFASVVAKHSFVLCSNIVTIVFRLELTIYFHHVGLEQR